MGRKEERSGNAYALAGEDAEGFAVYCVAPSEDFVKHPRQGNLLVTLSAHSRGDETREGFREGSAL